MPLYGFQPVLTPILLVTRHNDTSIISGFCFSPLSYFSNSTILNLMYTILFFLRQVCMKSMPSHRSFFLRGRRCKQCGNPPGAHVGHSEECLAAWLRIARNIWGRSTFKPGSHARLAFETARQKLWLCLRSHRAIFQAVAAPV